MGQMRVLEEKGGRVYMRVWVPEKTNPPLPSWGNTDDAEHAVIQSWDESRLCSMVEGNGQMGCCCG